LSASPRSWARRWAAGLGTAGLVGVLFAAFLLVTPWGLDLALRVLLVALHAGPLQARIDFGDIDGGLLTGFRIEDVDMVDGRGEPAVRLKAIEGALEVRPLWSGEVRVDRLALERPEVWVDTSTPGTNWSSIGASDDTEDDQSPPSVGIPIALTATVALDDATLHWIDRDHPEGRPRVTGIDLRGFARHAGGRWQFGVRIPRARAQGMDLELAARATLSDLALVLRDVRAQLGGVEATGTGRVGLDGGVAAALEARVRPGAPLLPSGLLPAGARARLDLRVEEGGRVFGAVGLSSTTSTATARVTFDGSGPSAEIDLDVAQLSLREIAEVAPPVTVRGELDARARWTQPFDGSAVDGRLDARLSGRLPNGRSFEGARAQGRIRAGRAEARVRLDMPQAKLALDAHGRLSPKIQPQRLVLTATVPELGAWLGSDVGGRTVLSVRGRGGPVGWTAQLHGRADAPHAGPWSASSARFAATATGAPTSLGTARATVESTGNRVGDLRVDRLAVEARRPRERQLDFVVRADGGFPVDSLQLDGTLTATTGLTLDVHRGRLDLARSPWIVEPFEARVAGSRVAWRGLETHSEVGFFESEGRFDFDRGTGHLDLRAQVDHLETLPGPIPGGSAGLSASLDFAPDGLRGRVDASTSGLELEPLARPLTAEVHARADPDVTLDATAMVDDGGTVGVDLALEAPADWRSPKAWLAWNRLRRVGVAFDELSLERWLTDESRVAGRLSGELKYDRRRRTLDFTADAARLTAPGVEVPVDVTARAGVNDASSTVEIESRVADREGLTVQGRSALSRAQLRDLDRVDLAREPLEVEGQLPSLPLSVVAKAAGLPESWAETATGSMSLDFAVSNQPSWRVELGASARGKIRSGAPDLDADLRLEVGRPGLSVTATVAGPGLGRAVARYDVGGPDAVNRWDRGRATLRLDAIALNGVRSLVVLPLDARGSVDGQAEWNLATDRGRADLRVRRLATGRALGPFNVVATGAWTSTVTALEGRMGARAPPPIRFEQRFDRGLGALLGNPGTTAMDGSWRVDDLDVAALLQDTYARKRIAGRITTTGTIAGTIGEPEVQMDARWNEARIGAQRFDELRASARRHPASGAAARLEMRQVEGGRFEVDVDVDSGAEEGGDVRADITASDFSIDFLSQLLGLATDATTVVEGELSADLHASGRMHDPGLDGELILTDLEVLVPGALPRLNRARVEVQATGPNLELRLRGRSGSRGRVELDATVGLDDLSSPRLDGRLSGEGVEYLAGILPLEATFDVDFEGRRVEDHFALDVVVARSRIIVTERDLASAYAPIQAVPDVVFVETFGVRPISRVDAVPPLSADPLSSTVHIENGEPIRFRGTDSQAVATVDLRIDVRDVTTRLEGAADVTDGTVTLFGREYRILKAIVRFTENHPPNPQLDIQLQHAFERVTLTVLVGGRVDDPKVRFASDPSRYDQSQLLAFFAGLANPDQDGPAGNPTTQAAGAAAGLVLGPLTKKVRQNLPIDTFDVSMGNGAPVVTVGKWLSETLFVAYTWTVESEANDDEQQGLVRWRFHPGWALEVIAGFNLQSADVFWVRRF